MSTAVVSDAYLGQVRSRLRITTTTLDLEIKSHISACREDLIRLGMNPVIVCDESNALILSAVRAYALWRFSSDDTTAERSRRDYYEMRDDLRKHDAYRAVSE